MDIQERIKRLLEERAYWLADKHGQESAADLAVPQSPTASPAMVKKHLDSAGAVVAGTTEMAGAGGRIASPIRRIKPVKLGAQIPPVEIPNGPVRGLGLRVAAILDEFSWLCWQYECHLIKLNPAHWRDQLTVSRPDFLFVESAWFGNDKQWGPIVVYKTQQPRDPLPALLAWCREHGIPTVFWNKEDPVHTDYFMGAAKLFDFVFTTDANCIHTYRARLGHDRVFALPFAAQPMIHNPAPVRGGRPYDVAFAGSWHTKAHDSRREGADVVLDPALDFGLHIYDRNFGTSVQPERYAWPDKYLPHIVGGVTYREMLAVYRQYKVFLNVNSVVDSPTMFSRRVFELLACGTTVISSPARGLDTLLGGGTVFVSKSADETRAFLKHLLGDAHVRQAAAERGIAAVMAEHTYGHRMREIVQRVGAAGSQGVPLLAVRDSLGRAVPYDPPNVYIPPNTPGLCLPKPPVAVIPSGPIKRPGLRVGAILDEVFEPCWRYECDIVQFGTHNFQDVLTEARPQLVFIDSAWRGNQHAWRFHVQRLKGKDPIGPSNEFHALIAWCRKAGIPTVFWNREDPPNYPHFIGAAQLCDYVFTTDSDCLSRYRKTCGHDRIGVLPFAAQPVIHNPVTVPGGRCFDVNFAGTWYAVKHTERLTQMDTILRPALKYGVHIWDRRLYHTVDDHYRYPEEFRRHIAGSLTYEETLAVMKQYRITLNVNSVIESPTMCSCRVFEGLMAGSAVISGYAKGIDNLLGRELVPMPASPTETSALIMEFLSNDDKRAITVHRAQRKILLEHTYSLRFDDILLSVGLREFVRSERRPLVSVISVVSSAQEVERVAKAFSDQTYAVKELVVVCMEPSLFGQRAEQCCTANGTDLSVVKQVAIRAGMGVGQALIEALRVCSGSFISVLASGDAYGAEFLRDLMLSWEYQDAEIVGKGTYYATIEPSDTLLLCRPELIHCVSESVALSAFVAKRSVFKKVSIASMADGSGDDFFRRCKGAGIKCYSADKFSYVARYGEETRGRVFPRLGDVIDVPMLSGNSVSMKNVMV